MANMLVLLSVLGAAVDSLPSPSPAPKMVAAFLLASQQLTHAPPHLPLAVLNQYPGKQLRGLYRVCLDTSGQVAAVSVMVSIPGGDDAVTSQIRSGWRYAPQPVPVCFAASITFKIAPGPAPQLVTASELARFELAHRDPYLPAGVIAAHPGQMLYGAYQVCVAVDGRISGVLPVVSIPGADDAIIRQITDGWRYQPLAQPTCFVAGLRYDLH
jgi:hypothetical protein